MPKFGSVFIEDSDVHPVKEKIKSKLGNVAGLSKILSRSGATNFDFWVGRDGILWIGENNSGGQEKKTELNFFTAFPAYAPKVSDLKSNRPDDWDPYAGLSDDDSSGSES